MYGFVSRVAKGWKILNEVPETVLGNVSSGPLQTLVSDRAIMILRHRLSLCIVRYLRVELFKEHNAISELL